MVSVYDMSNSIVCLSGEIVLCKDGVKTNRRSGVPIVVIHNPCVGQLGRRHS